MLSDHTSNKETTGMLLIGKVTNSGDHRFQLPWNLPDLEIMSSVPHGQWQIQGEGEVQSP